MKIRWTPWLQLIQWYQDNCQLDNCQTDNWQPDNCLQYNQQLGQLPTGEQLLWSVVTCKWFLSRSWQFPDGSCPLAVVQLAVVLEPIRYQTNLRFWQDLCYLKWITILLSIKTVILETVYGTGKSISWVKLSFSFTKKFCHFEIVFSHLQVLSIDFDVATHSALPQI